MGRKYFDCRDYPGGVKCSVVLSADTVDELIETVMHHNIAIHGEKDTEVFRQMIRNEVKEGSPPT
jgi:predicted small metal-binding protein